MPGRKFTSGSSYRYGFNGKENDNEVKGEGNQQDYGMRIYDPRLGRFLSVDPIAAAYPMLTPYQFASNTPIRAIDFDGLEGIALVYDDLKMVVIKVDVIYVLHRISASLSVTHNSPRNLIKAVEKEISKLSPQDLIDPETGYAVKFLFTTLEYPSVEEAEAYIVSVVDNVFNPTQFFDLIPEKVEVVTLQDANGNDVEYQNSTKGKSHWRRLFFTSTNDEHNVVHEFWHNFMHNYLNAPIDIKNQIDKNDQEPGHFAAGGIFQIKCDGTKDNHTSRDRLPLNGKNVKDALRTIQRVRIKESQPSDDPRGHNKELDYENNTNA